MGRDASRRAFLTWSARLASTVGLTASVPDMVAARDRAAAGGSPHEQGLAMSRPFASAIAPDIDAAIGMAIGNVACEGFTDVLPRQFEADLLDDVRLRRRLHERTRTVLIEGRFDRSCVAAVELLSLPKRMPLAVRRVAVIDPADAILYLALAILAAPQIELYRVAPVRQRVFSYRYAPGSGHLFDQGNDYTRFVDAANERMLAQPDGVAVMADIECFYERISIARLCASLADCSVDAAVVARVAGLLEFWREHGSEGGLPIGSNASRILAEAVLLAPDRALEAAGVEFVRFVDDYRFFAPDLATAQRWLALLADRIEAVGLSLNPCKTRIVRVADVLATEPFADAVLRTQLPWREAQVDETDPRQKGTRIKPKGKDSKENPKKPPDIIKRPDYDPVSVDPKGRKDRRGDLQGVDLEALRVVLLDGADLKPNALACVFVDAALDQGDAAAIGVFPRLMERYPQFSTYCTAALIAAADELEPAVRVELADHFARLLAAGSGARDYVRMQAIQLLACPAIARPEAVAGFLQQQDVRRNGYVARTALEALRTTATAAELLDFLPAFASFGGWARRSLIAWAVERGVAHRLPPDVAQSGDLFAQALMERAAATG